MKNKRKRIQKCTFQENYGTGNQVQDEDWIGTAKGKNEMMDSKLRGMGAQNMKNKRKRTRKSTFQENYGTGNQAQGEDWIGTAKGKNQKMDSKLRGM